METAVEVVSMVEKSDRVVLIISERLAVAMLLAFAFRHLSEIISDDMVSVMIALQDDRYTSATYRKISRIGRMLRSRPPNTCIIEKTDRSLLLGSIFLVNMSIFAPMSEWRRTRDYVHE